MSKFIKLDSTLTSVTSFSGNFDARELSARPQFTGDRYFTLTNNFSAIKTFEGYGFDSVTYVMLSCTSNSPLFSGFGSVSAYNFDTVSTLSADYPEVSGFPTTNYILNNYNTMTVTFPTVTATGEVDIIAINPAGYGILGADVGTTGITIN